MSVTLPTEAEVLASAIAYFQIAHRDPITGKTPPLGPRDFLGQEARALASLIGEVLAGGKAVDDDAIPGTYVDSAGVTRTRNSSKALDDWATTLGVPSNSTSGYGRKTAQAARNGGAYATGSAGVMVSTGAQLTDPSGTVTVQLRTGFTMPGSESQAIVLDAVTTGETGNLPAGTVLRWTSPPPGLATTVTLGPGLTGGFDIEDDVSLALRTVRRLRDRPKGGSAADFREWAESAEDGSGALVGVEHAHVYPLRDGTGSVTIVPTMGGSGSARIPSTAQVTQIQTWVDALRIASDKAYVVKPRVVSGEELSITVLIHAASGYEFEWTEGVVSMQVVSGSGVNLVIDTDPPTASLADAIDNGDDPRIAINLASSPLPFVSRVTAYQVSTPMAGKSTLTLETTLPSAPAGGEFVLPAGGAVIPVAAAILGFVDSVGPSRSSGFADPLDPWEDTISIGRIAEVALSARDSTSGERVCVWSPDVGNATGVTIKVGAGSPSGDDFLLFDNVPGQGPQIPEVASITIKRAT